MTDIFVSYANNDLARIRPVIDTLQRRGWSVWWDRRILAGSRWADAIENALKDSRCVVVLWSRNSIESDWVRTEAEEARARGILVPVLLDDVVVPLAFRGIQAAKLLSSSEMTSSTEFDELVRAVSAILSKSTSVPLVERAESVAATTTSAAPLPGGIHELSALRRNPRTNPSRKMGPTPMDGRALVPHLPAILRFVTTRRGALLAVAVMVLAFFVIPIILIDGHWNRVDAFGSAYGTQSVWALVRPVPGNQTLSLPILEGRVFGPEDYGSGRAIWTTT